jgi:hypothetical protein
MVVMTGMGHHDARSANLLVVCSSSIDKSLPRSIRAYKIFQLGQLSCDNELISKNLSK